MDIRYFDEQVENIESLRCTTQFCQGKRRL
nr:unnamed protein product [Callosobruchus analis]